MEFVCIEAKTFMEMNEALEAIARRVHETCGGSTRGMDEWIDNQEACTLMDVSPRKMLQLRRSGSIPYTVKYITNGRISSALWRRKFIV